MTLKLICTYVRKKHQHKGHPIISNMTVHYTLEILLGHCVETKQQLYEGEGPKVMVC